jgi:hypothetical protein
MNIKMTGTFKLKGDDIVAWTECNTCLFNSSFAKIHDDGECEYCKLQQTLKASANPEDWNGILNKIKDAGEGKKYDCLIGVSGGEDSSILLYMAVTSWGLRPLVIHFNNRSNRPEADNNIRVITDKLNVNFIEYFVEQHEYNQLTDAFLYAGVQDADIPNDIAMAKLMFEAAKQYGIKYILNGHDYAREGSSPAAWSYMDAKYVESVYGNYTQKKLQNYPLYTFWDQIVQGIIGIKQVRPYHYMPKLDRSFVLNELKKLGWRDYGGKHNENIYTAFVGSWLLPRKFGIDKRVTYLSAQIREGFIDKEFARSVLATDPEFNLDDLGARKDQILRLVDYAPIRKREKFARYNFKRWKFVIWVLAKLKIVPYTMLFKYCK